MRSRSAGFSLGQLVAALAAILTAALVLPAVAATMVNRARVEAAARAAHQIADALGRGGAADWRPGTPAAVDLLSGAGESPRTSVDHRWGSSRSELLESHLARGDAHLVAPDPWGNRFLVNVGTLQSGAPGGVPERPRRAVWVLSAGPNGVIETPFDQPAESARPGGDDVGVRMR